MRKRSIAVYGKGGIGKSTVVSSLSLLFARDGARVLQIGCDPKADSSHLHVPIERIRPVMPGLIADRPAAAARRWALGCVAVGRTGVHCLETGGPEPGLGCAGYGVSSALEAFDRIPGFFDRYDVVLYDILGDVVCGGFTLPLRAGRAQEVYILASGDAAALFAANNIARAVRRHAGSGARLAGIICNRAAPDEAVGPADVARLARRLGTRVVAALPEDPAVRAAALRGATASELFPKSKAAAACRKLYAAVRAVKAADLVVPAPLDGPELVSFLRGAGAYGKPR